MRSSYYFLPSDQQGFVDEDGQTIPVDFMNKSAYKSLSHICQADTEHPRDEFYKHRLSPLCTEEGHGVRPGEHNSEEDTAHPTQLSHEVAQATKAEKLDFLSRTLDRVAQFRKDIEEGYDPAKAHLYPPCEPH